MKLEDAKKIVAAAKEDGTELRLYENYSGRSTFGETTTGIVGSLAEIGYYAGVAKVPVKSFRWDSMGKSDSVCY